jgi:hypothetical protein
MLSQRSRCARRSAAAVPSAVYALP